MRTARNQPCDFVAESQAKGIRQKLNRMHFKNETNLFRTSVKGRNSSVLRLFFLGTKNAYL